MLYVLRIQSKDFLFGFSLVFVEIAILFWVVIIGFVLAG